MPHIFLQQQPSLFSLPSLSFCELLRAARCSLGLATTTTTTSTTILRRSVRMLYLSTNTILRPSTPPNPLSDLLYVSMSFQYFTPIPPPTFLKKKSILVSLPAMHFLCQSKRWQSVVLICRLPGQAITINSPMDYLLRPIPFQHAFIFPTLC